MVRVAFVFDAVLTDLHVEEKGDLACAAPVIGSNTTTVNCSAVSFAPVNFNSDISFDASVPQGERLVMVAASITSAAQDTYPTDNTSSAVTAIITNADLSVQIVRGDNTATDEVYDITVRNAGPDPVSNIALRTISNLLNDWTMPPPLRFSIIDDRWRCFSGIESPFGRAWTCSLFSALESGDSSTFTVTVPLSMHKAGYSVESSLQTRFDPVLRNNSTRMRLGMPPLPAMRQGSGAGHASGADASPPATGRRGNGPIPRSADHVPSRARIGATQGVSDMEIILGSVDSGNVLAGRTFHGFVTLANLGPDPAQFPAVAIASDAVLPDLHVEPPFGWTCGSPVIANGMTSMACNAQSMQPSNGNYLYFDFDAIAPPDRSGQVVNFAGVVTSQSQDPVSNNNSDDMHVVVFRNADVQASAQGPLRTHAAASYIARVTNAGPSSAQMASARIRVELPPDVVTLTAPTGWSCDLTVGADSVRSCHATGELPSNSTHDIVVTIRNPYNKAGYKLQFWVESSADFVPANNTASTRLGMPRP